MAAGAPVSDPFRLLSPWHLHRYSTFLCVIATGPILQACFPTCDKVMPEPEGTANVSACVSKFSSRRISIRWANALNRQMSMPKPVCPTLRPPVPSARRAQTAEKQHAGLLKLDAQPRLG